MTTTTTLLAPIKLAVPRAARSVLASLNTLMGRFERAGEARACRQMRAQRVREAAAVREYALRFASHDPRFAADLMAAADRHETSK